MSAFLEPKETWVLASTFWDEVSELGTLAELHDRGKLTDGEFAAEKARLLGAEASVPV
jgi:Short C-terminal domain